MLQGYTSDQNNGCEKPMLNFCRHMNKIPKCKITQMKGASLLKLSFTIILSVIYTLV